MHLMHRWGKWEEVKTYNSYSCNDFYIGYEPLYTKQRCTDLKRTCPKCGDIEYKTVYGTESGTTKAAYDAVVVKESIR